MWYAKWKNSVRKSASWFLGGPDRQSFLPGYGSNRSELLTLAFSSGNTLSRSALICAGTESQVKWSGWAATEGRSSFGNKVSESKEDRHRPGAFRRRVGLYGVIWARISRWSSSQDPGVKAVAVDSVYLIWALYRHRLKTFVGTDSSAANTLVDSPWTSDLTDLVLQLYLMPRRRQRGAESAAACRFQALHSRKNTGALNAHAGSALKQGQTLAETEHSRCRLYDKASAEYDARIMLSSSMRFR
jgi:hypothetical protein